MEDRTIFQPRGGGNVGPGVRLNGVYEIESLIAQGGMGEVFKGFNIQTGDPVAIKMIRAELSRNAEALALFRREASILHNLVHDAIVRYFVFSVDPDLERAYLAMEFVDGPSLAKRLTAGPMSLAEVKVLQTRVAGALDAAHKLGVVHRDISSDNIILQGGDVNRAKVIDFGIARSQRPGEGTIIGGGFAGKYNYVSPEQLGLGGGDVTYKSDIYSFGLVLAEALMGRPIDMAGSQAEIVEKRRRVPDLSEIDPAMRPLLTRMLQPSPADRPASMAEIAAWRAPEKASGSAAPEPPRKSLTPSPPRPDRSSKGGGAFAAIGVLIALIGVGAAGYAFRDEIAGWIAGLTAQPAPKPQPIKPPPLPPLPPTPSPQPVTPPLPPPTPATPAPTPPTPVQPAPPAPAPAPAPAPTPAPVAPPHVPTAAELIDALPPRAPQPSVALPQATVGAPYRADLPAFVDPGGKGLRIRAEGLPEGLTLTDLGEGKAAIEGVPTREDQARATIVAINHNNVRAQMTAAISVVARVAPIAPPPQPKPAPAPPRPSQARVVLEGATVGEEFRAALPPFSSGANSRNLALHPEPSPPEGLTFADLGSGLSEISGKPSRVGEFAFEVVGTDASGQTARMQVRIAIAPGKAPARPPVEPAPPPQPVAPTPAPQPEQPKPQPVAPQPVAPQPVAPQPVAPAPVAPQPQPRPEPPKPQPQPATPKPPPSPQPVAPQPQPQPEQPQPQPVPPQPVAPEPVAPKPQLQPEQPTPPALPPKPPAPQPVAPQPAPESTPSPLPPPAPSPAPQPAPEPVPQPAPPQPEPAPQPAAPSTVEARAAAFVGAFDGGPCFVVRPLAGGEPNAFEAIGADRAIFQRFDEGYTQNVGVEARLSARLIAAAECPALPLVKLASSGASGGPRLELASYEVGRGKPLAGKISNLAGRRVTLIVIDNDGVAHRLDAKPLPGGDAAVFTVPMVADASSVGPLQTVIAIASSRPLPSLEGLRAAPSADLTPRVLSEIGAAQGEVDAQFFKLAN